jgi:4-oxalocrotonate tautomerase family enzyme
MPILHCNLIKDVFSDEEKQKLIASVTDAVVDVKGEGIRDLVTVVLHEVESGDVGKAGKSVTRDKVLSMTES